MRRNRHVVGAVLLGLLCACAAEPPAPVTLTAPSPSGARSLDLRRATVLNVFDADSIEMRLDDGRDLHVQLIGIDAPDAGKPERGHANAFVRSRLVKGRSVYIEQGPQMWDDLGRMLAYVWLKRPSRGTLAETSKTMLNAMMLVAGFAHVEPEDENPKYATLFGQLERSAKSKRKGIWS